MSLLFNILFRFVIAFLSRNKCFCFVLFFNFVAAVTIQSDSGTQENKVCHCFHCFPFYLSGGNGTRCHDLHLWNVELAFSLSSFTFIKRLFSSSSFSVLNVVSSALIFLLAILIPACESFSPAFHMMYSEISRMTICNLDILLSQF